MNINPVLRNESKLSVRTPKFTIMIFVYVAILSVATVLMYMGFNEPIFTNGLDLNSSIMLYVIMAIAQAVLLIFIVPSLTSTAICSEREKQTLDILLSSKLTPLQIIIGKVSASALKVIMLIICTMPLYAVCSLIGGVKLNNIFELIVFFIINTIFVSSMGVFISTYVKTSKAATALTYGLVLFIYIGIVIIGYLIMMFAIMKSNTTGVYVQPKMPILMYLSPIVGFISMIFNQVGLGFDFSYLISEFGISAYAHYISIGIQLVLSGVLIFLASIKLNPLNNKKRFKKKGVK